MNCQGSLTRLGEAPGLQADVRYAFYHFALFSYDSVGMQTPLPTGMGG